MENSILTMLLKLGHMIDGLSIFREDDVVWSCFVPKMLGGFKICRIPLIFLVAIGKQNIDLLSN